MSDISNSLKLAQIIRLKAILLSGEFQENRILGSTDICLGNHSKPHIWRYFLLFVVISQIWQIIRLIAILISGEFQENRILGSTDICLGTKYCTLVQFGTESPTRHCRQNTI